jgi:hypothetical protein
MSAVTDEPISTVLRAYADLSATPARSASLVVAPFTEVQTVAATDGYDGSFGLRGAAGSPVSEGLQALGTHSDVMRNRLPLRAGPTVERLAKLDALHADEVLLRHSWVVVVGTTELDGEPTRVLQPLLSRPVRVRRRGLLQRAAGALDDSSNGATFALEDLGDAEVTPWIGDPDQRAQLLTGATFGKGALRMSTSEALVARMPELTGWIRRTGLAAGWRIERILGPDEDPADWISHRGLVAIPVHWLHTVRQVNVTSMRSTLLGWAGRRGIAPTAFGATLGRGASERRQKDAASDDTRPNPARVESPMLLSDSQRAVLRRARTQPLTVVSGAPGSGKTHALCAVALDTVAAGGSVLVATQSRHAADVVTELLERTPGPAPVRFGDGAGMASLIDELNDRMTHPVDDATVDRLERELRTSRVEVDALRDTIAAELRLEADARDAERWQHALPSLVTIAPGVFDPASDLDELSAMVVAATPRDGLGWWARRRVRRARRLLDAAAGSTPSTELSQITPAIDAARAGRARATLESRGGVRIGDRWTALAEASARHRDAVGRRLQIAPFEPSALDAGARASVGALLAALRAGRGRRRELLAELRPGQLTATAPLWVGTLADIEDVLPAAPAMFDLVILDEASQIEQPRAAPALLRGRRGMVVGDPHQLRHVSFRSDAEVSATLAAHGLAGWQGTLDLRRVSAFDLAAAAAPIDHLREHFRSVPHLIEFSVRRFYRERVEVMTRHPRNEQLDAIDVVTVDAPEGSGAKVHPLEIAAVEEVVRDRGDRGETSIGVVSPFRDQADALEQALIERFTAAEIQRMGLRVGTVHSFQGGERDVVVASWGVAEDDPPGRRRFAEQPDLFNVMVTRARREMVVVTSLPLATSGIMGEYLRHADHALSPQSSTSLPGSDTGQWRDALAAELARHHTVRVDYPVGPWLLDLCVGEGDDARLLECAVHPDGVDAHIERRLALMGLGWTVVDAFPSRWEHDAVRAALELR